jgi:hypothetical protein
VTIEKEDRPHHGPAPTTQHQRPQDSAADARREAAVGRDERRAGWHRREWTHDLKSNRRIVAELDRLLLVDQGHDVDGGDGGRGRRVDGQIGRGLRLLSDVGDDADPYADGGLTMGWPERCAAGRAGLEAAA